MAITDSEIHAAADKIAEAGERPTLAKVRAALGGGSFTTIGEALKTWRDTQSTEHELAQIDLPSSVRERLESSTAALWSAAIAEAERRLNAERDALAEAREQAEAATAEAREAVATLEIEAEQQQQQIDELRATLAAAEQRAQRAEVGEQAAQARLESTAREITNAEKRAEKAQAKAEKALEEAAELRGKLSALTSK